MRTVINRLYELTTYRDGEKLGEFLFHTTHGTDTSSPIKFSERFLIGVDYDLAELSEIHPATLTDGEISESFGAHLICTWPPLQ